MTQQCHYCDSTSVTTQLVSGDMIWGKSSETFPITYPVKICTDCQASWLDHEAEEAITLAQFCFEQKKGIQRSQFVNETERRLWVAARIISSR